MVFGRAGCSESVHHGIAGSRLRSWRFGACETCRETAGRLAAAQAAAKKIGTGASGLVIAQLGFKEAMKATAKGTTKKGSVKKPIKKTSAKKLVPVAG